MHYSPHGNHLIAGSWIGTAARFDNDPVQGPSHGFSVGTPELIDQACAAAEDAFASYGHCPDMVRASFLDSIADHIEARGEIITDIASRETGLPRARLDGERARTTGQLRLFAEHVRKGGHLDRRHDPALPDRQPPRPDIRLIQRPIGPVAVFGASNFPLAFSTAGGDTAAALAAGCPVVVKGHPAHPGTAEIIAEAVHAAIVQCDIHPGTFSLIQGDSHEIGQALVSHPLIRAVGFTGSLAGGRALFDICAARPEPIPFFGELGSINPMFVLPAALARRGAEIARGWAASLTLGAGQFCTNPGIVVLRDGADADIYVQAAAEALARVEPQTMLTQGIAQAYRQGQAWLDRHPDLRAVLRSDRNGREALPSLYQTTGAAFMADPGLGHEVFGPLGLIVRVTDSNQMRQLAMSLPGQLTATLHLDDDDLALAATLMPVLERKAGRVLANGYPTGVEVCDAMVHGGPYPASTNFGATSVGTLSIRRFLRPVCYQNLPQALLPENLR
ncbi:MULTISPECIES: aldehyde dehydrogenase (NADP(+)) [unclassified Paracoccus (in: a-proteobacteria)]|uniref:aldehyde dehydrogenase (NADP(+)) n=1 Tax=unclassified Paracoccus (in: a-proteobacteria) TaxID=2688777 RepID=UPI0012B1A749|nr:MULTISPECIES: aldehyde dehydrogenase (NADP(+)) [unclassified Paracoccus (in: a-proteobacteria)]UXU74300.1 aldehyde dehydrogenase (NADP(+)) [Paracoccus sp. SMMA_5]UXU80190.1 aldehyde dehydrogenase (NADP(+)) [Paracoccus sp. SMMA_5_TC]